MGLNPRLSVIPPILPFFHILSTIKGQGQDLGLVLWWNRGIRATLFYQLDVYFLCTLYFVIELLLEQTGYSVWINLLCFGYFFVCTVCGSTREWIYFILDIIHILKQTVELYRLSEYFYADIWCDRIFYRIRIFCVIGY